jgi:methionine-rich copper-binding protein CopC
MLVTGARPRFRRALAGVAALALLLLVAPVVSAHANLKSATILPGAVITTAPATLTLTFTEATSPTLTRVTVTNAAGARVDKNDLRVKDDTATIGLNPLPNGVYTVTFRTVVEEDGHVVDGQYTFTVGGTPVAGSVSNARQTEGRTPSAAPKTGAGGMAEAGLVDDEARAALLFGLVGIIGLAWWGRRRRIA